MIVILDTNIYISALFWGGKPSLIINNALEGDLKIFVSNDILQEIRRVLEQKFNLSIAKVEEVTDAILSFAQIIEPREKIKLIVDDPTDNMILECAKSCNADYIISGDKHLLDLKKFKNIPILKPDKFLKVCK